MPNKERYQTDYSASLQAIAFFHRRSDPSLRRDDINPFRLLPGAGRNPANQVKGQCCRYQIHDPKTFKQINNFNPGRGVKRIPARMQ